MSGNRPSSSDANRPSAFETAAHQMSQFIGLAKATESALHQERDRSLKLESELKEAHALYDRLLKEEKARQTEISVQFHRMKTNYLSQLEEEKNLKVQMQLLGQDHLRIKQELEKYQSAWSKVLDREREAKEIIRESENSARKMAELQKRLELAERTVQQEREIREKMEKQARLYRDELDRELRTLDHAMDTMRGVNPSGAQSGKIAHTRAQTTSSLDDFKIQFESELEGWSAASPAIPVKDRQ